MDKWTTNCGRLSRWIYVLVLFVVQGSFSAESESYNELPVGFTSEGHAYIGSKTAPVILEEWSDYLCPFCLRHYQQTLPQLLDQYVRTGDLKIIFRDFPLASLHPTAALGHVSARCAGRQDEAIYWEMHDALFTRQAEWNRLSDPSVFLEGIVDELGIDLARYRACIEDGVEAQAVSDSVVEGMQLGYNGTPSFRFIASGGEKSYTLSGALPLDRFARYANPLIAGEEIPEEAEPEPPEMPFWSKPEGLAPDPDRPGFNMAGDAFKGNPDAKIAVIEFNDFQCPACQKHALEAQPVIDEQLVETGRILWVEKHLPLKMHEYAPIAAVAAECAGDQQEYWRMNKALHASSARWANEDAEATLPTIAKEIGLDMPAFQACFDSRNGLERVLADIYDAQGLITRAPTFVIMQGDRGSATGPLAAEQFVSMLERRLESIEAASVSTPSTATD